MNLSENPLLKKLILDRMTELDMKAGDLVKDASERKYEINPSRFSKWKAGKPGGLNDNNLIWIAERLGIQYNINFGAPKVINGKLVYEVGRYNELAALKRLNILFKKK